MFLGDLQEVYWSVTSGAMTGSSMASQVVHFVPISQQEELEPVRKAELGLENPNCHHTELCAGVRSNGGVQVPPRT